MDFDKVYAGLPPHDWHALKELVLGAARGDKSVSIPPHLLEHEAAQHLGAFVRTRDNSNLDRAAEALCPLYPDKAWLVLEKS